jgi:hypothetical protein
MNDGVEESKGVDDGALRLQTLLQGEQDCPLSTASERLLYGGRLAVVIGCSYYGDPERNLIGAETDANAMAKLLSSKGYTLVTSADENVGPELDPGVDEMNTVLGRLGDAIKDCRTPCTVIVYFAGHGVNDSVLLYTSGDDDDEEEGGSS